MSMKTWKVRLRLDVEKIYNLQVEAVDEDTAGEIAEDIFYAYDRDILDVWESDLDLSVDDIEEVQSEPPERESHLQIVRTGT